MSSTQPKQRKEGNETSASTYAPGSRGVYRAHRRDTDGRPGARGRPPGQAADHDLADPAEPRGHLRPGKRRGPDRLGSPRPGRPQPDRDSRRGEPGDRLRRLPGPIPSGATTVVCHLSDVFLPPGEYHLFAVYTGDGNYLPADSSATPQSLTVAKEPTATTLALPAATLAFDQQGGALLTFQVTAATSGTPTGSVTVTAGSTPICSAVLANGTGTCALATGELGPGNYQLIATYGGDGDFAGSASDLQALTITSAPTVTTLTLSTAKVTFGHEQAERLSIQVTATGSTPTGQVAVSAGSTTLCMITLDGGNGSCTLAATKLRPGTYHLTATYSGDVTHAGSTSGSKVLAVASEPTATALTLSTTKVKFGHEQAEHLTVTVKPGFSGTPAGKVTMNAGATRSAPSPSPRARDHAP